MWDQPGDPPAHVLTQLPVETVVLRAGGVPIGWWDGESLQPVVVRGIWDGERIIPDPDSEPEE